MFQALDLGALKLWSDRRNDAFGEAILQIEYVAQFPVKAIGQMCIPVVASASRPRKRK